ncbi:hypothetical protein ASPCADRAFT_202828, partial [Aspergillus carbonarius ITEM 5010]
MSQTLSRFCSYPQEREGGTCPIGVYLGGYVGDTLVRRDWKRNKRTSKQDTTDTRSGPPGS